MPTLSTLFNGITMFDRFMDYPIRRATDALNDDNFRGWSEELHDYAWYNLRMSILNSMEKLYPSLNRQQVYYLSYPISRLFNIVLRDRQFFGWKREMMALARISMKLFAEELFNLVIVKAIIFVYIIYAAELYSEHSVLELLFNDITKELMCLLIFAVSCWRARNHFSLLPLDQFNNAEN
ncbi:hypothetical protein Ddc_11625 [Ditylenchus destructor]|nr:hypothetical protein Ddc_11625 [Ditylenchus destructor]